MTTDIRAPGARPRMPAPTHPGAVPPPVRVGAIPAAHRSAPSTSVVVRRPRPDPGPLRIAIGLTGLATASALMTTFLTPAVASTPATGGAGVASTADTPDAVRHVTRIVRLAPGQTAPPNAVVQQAPAPQPQRVLVRTRQSGG